MPATNAKIVSFSGHDVKRSILKDYIMQTKEAALNARRKMGSYFSDENGSETPDFMGLQQRVRQTPGGKSPDTLCLSEENGGSDGT